MPNRREDLGGEDVAGHKLSWSDENLKQAVSELEGALEALLRLDRPSEDAEVEGHGRMLSDENLKQAVTKLEDALEALLQMSSSARS